MTLKEFLEVHYGGNEWLEKFKEKFPRMYSYSEKVFVLDWQPEFAVADKNPEVVDEIEFWRMLFQNGLISREEFQKRIDLLPRYASKTLGIAFMESDEVAFRERKPTLEVILHELGHCYYKKPDTVWSAVYTGGEFLMWLILKDLYQGSEEDVKRYMELMEVVYTKPEEVLNKMESTARVLCEKYFSRETDGFWNYVKTPYRNLVKLCNCTGYMPQAEAEDKRALAFSVLANALHAIAYKDFLPVWSEFIRELISPTLRVRRTPKAF